MDFNANKIRYWMFLTFQWDFKVHKVFAVGLVAEKALNWDFSRESVLSLEASLSLLFSISDMNNSTA